MSRRQGSWRPRTVVSPGSRASASRPWGRGAQFHHRGGLCALGAMPMRLSMTITPLPNATSAGTCLPQLPPRPRPPCSRITGLPAPKLACQTRAPSCAIRPSTPPGGSPIDPYRASQTYPKHRGLHRDHFANAHASHLQDALRDSLRTRTCPP